MTARHVLVPAILIARALSAQGAPDRVRADPLRVPNEARAIFARSPLADGDGALFVVVAGDSAAVAVGTAVVDSTNASTVCAVARLRAERELVRLIVGVRLDSRIVLGTSERTGSAVQQQFGETITESVAGQLVGAALASQWWADRPRRCRVGLWLKPRSERAP
ncbi:MAG TPA: hypothetical protein VMV51_00660 [Gemmatimonadaceae bacterium]|nr:hypothetical protein [Gemmatimonadaceae bacterium]